MNVNDFETLAKSLAPVIKQFVSMQAELLRKEFVDQISELKNLIPIAIDGKDGADGKSVTVDDVRPMIQELVDKATAQIEIPEPLPGKDGIDGKSVTVEEVIDALTPEISASFKQVTEFCERALDDLTVKVGDAIKAIPEPKDGEKGEDGKSITLEDVSPIIEIGIENIKSTVDEFIRSIRLPEDGKSVTVDDVEPLIKTAIENAISKIQLPENGKDATEIEILPTIDKEKSYSRGTYASFKGGLWRSFEKTFGMRGWECIVNGIANVQVEPKDDRTLEIVVVNSSGEYANKQLAVPSMIYRGVFRDGDEYSKGDIVTFGGSAWHCNEEKTKARPGTSGDWTLCVKRGRDYKEPISIKKIDPKAPVKIR